MIKIADAYVQFEADDRKLHDSLGRVDAAFKRSAANAEASAARMKAAGGGVTVAMQGAGTAVTNFGTGGGGAVGGLIPPMLRIVGITSLIGLGFEAAGVAVKTAMEAAKVEVNEVIEGVKRLTGELQKLFSKRDANAAKNVKAAREEAAIAKDPKLQAERLEMLKEQRKLQAQNLQKIQDNQQSTIAQEAARLKKTTQVPDDKSMRSMKLLDFVGRATATFQNMVSKEQGKLMALDRQIAAEQKRIEETKAANLKKQMLAEKQKDVVGQQRLNEENKQADKRIAKDKAAADERVKTHLRQQELDLENQLKQKAKDKAQKEGIEEVELAMIRNAGLADARPGRAEMVSPIDLARNIQLAISNDQSRKRQHELEIARTKFLETIAGDMATAVKDLKENLSRIGVAQ